jgi:lipoyl(octanoyl) transferase
MVEHSYVFSRDREATTDGRLMHLDHASYEWTTPTGSALRVYLLGVVEYEAALSLQRTLAFEAASERDSAALVLCEHPPIVTVGRDGSPADIRCDFNELGTRGWPVRWVNRGGGSLLHLPGQLAMYPILPLDWRHLGLADYLERLHRIVVAVLDDFSVKGETRPGQPGVWVGLRHIAGVGVAVSDWVAYYGVYLNLNPDLLPFRIVRTGPSEQDPMTSLVSERRAPVRPALVRERLLEHFASVFPFARISLFSNHPCLGSRPARAGRLSVT